MSAHNHKVVLISVNDTLTPITGGEYTYKTMKDELLRQGYKLREISVPILLKNLSEHNRKRKKIENLYRVPIHVQCILESLFKRCQRRYLVITSSSPAFPVFGHLVYHQPKTNICNSIAREYMSLYEQLGMLVHENEKLSPIWWFAKRSHILHLSNSQFTKRLVEELYGLRSTVLYPPVPIPEKPAVDTSDRVPGVVIARPRAISGITLLPAIVKTLQSKIRFVVIGKADGIGLEILKSLKRKGVKIDYLGYVNESTKLDVFTRFSHYLHLGSNESFGITVVEAMSAGCIPIAPNSGALPEYLPGVLLYSYPQEAAEKIDERVGLNDSSLERRLRNIADRFSEGKFRTKFAAHVSELDEG